MTKRTMQIVLASMTLANAMILVDQTAVPLALPSVMQNFGVGSQPAQWVLNASLLPLAGLLVFGGRLGDVLGRRRIFLVGSLIFAGASALGGLAPTFPILLVFRVLQGVGGALMLPNTVAIVSASFPAKDRGRALGTMGGFAAVAGALGPTIGGALTAAVSWRAVLLINVPLAALAVGAALRAVPKDPDPREGVHLDLAGTFLLSLALICLVFGLAQSQVWRWTSPGVVGPLAVSVIAAAAFVWVERRATDPLLSFGLLGRHPNYLAATIGQTIAGMAEMGLGLLFPLLLILNLQMPPGLAGLALIPSTLPMILVAPLAGRWYDRVGGRPPLVVGFGTMVASGVALALGVGAESYAWILPGLFLYGIGLALVLTVNDPVSLDTVPSNDHGQASGVSATAEQFGGAVGIALLYLIFHASYVHQLTANIQQSPLHSLSAGQGEQFKQKLFEAEQTGLHASAFGSLSPYLRPAQEASAHGYAVAFIVAGCLALVGMAVAAWMVRRPTPARADA